MKIARKKPQHTSLPYWLFALAFVSLYFLVNYNYTAYRFIEYGMPLLDAGYMSGAIWQNPRLMIPIIEPITSWHDYHLTLIGSIWAMLSYVIDFIPFKYYSALHAGSLSFVIAMAAWVFYQKSRICGEEQENSLFRATTLLFLFAMSGPMLSIAEFPHTEVLYGGVGITFLYAALNRNRKLLILSLFGLFIIREDIPAHAGLILFSIFLALSINTKHVDIKSPFLWGSLLMLLLSIAAVIIQLSFFSAGTSLKVSVLGNPPLSHLDQNFFENRLPLRIIRSAYVWIPAVIAVVFAVIHRNALLAVGSIAIIPWLLLCWVAVARGAGVFDYHYAFPQIVLLLWPTILSTSAFRNVWTPEISSQTIWRLQLCLLVASSTCYLSIRAIDLYRFPFSQTRYINYLENIGEWYSISSNQWKRFSDDISLGQQLADVRVSEGVASINPTQVIPEKLLLSRHFRTQLSSTRCLFMMDLLTSYDRERFQAEFPFEIRHKFSGVSLRCKNDSFPDLLNSNDWLSAGL
ncbi:hypothetical protein OAS86_05785 [Gammaproteobacteria bacterium]|nr:hypothetical protein [Gammaproteobacteria bacterium]